jgi:hypothetical protein
MTYKSYISVTSSSSLGFIYLQASHRIQGKKDDMSSKSRPWLSVKKNPTFTVCILLCITIHYYTTVNTTNWYKNEHSVLIRARVIIIAMNQEHGKSYRKLENSNGITLKLADI